MFNIFLRVESMTTNVLVLIFQTFEDQRLHFLFVQLAVYSRDMSKTKQSITANVEMPVFRQSDANLSADTESSKYRAADKTATKSSLGSFRIIASSISPGLNSGIDL